MDEVFSDLRRSTRNTFVVNLEKFGRILSRRVVPFITPELCQNLVDFDRVTSDIVINVFDGGNSFLGNRKRATNSRKLVGGSFSGRVVGIGSKLSVDKIQKSSTVTVRRKERVDSGMKRVIFENSATVDLARRVCCVENSDSVPEEAVTIRFEVGGGTNFKMGSSKNLLECREILKRASLRLRILPQTSDRIQELRGIHNGGREARGGIPVCKIRGKGYSHWNVIRDVGTSFVLVRECVDVLIGSERGDRVMVPMSVGR